MLVKPKEKTFETFAEQQLSLLRTQLQKRAADFASGLILPSAVFPLDGLKHDPVSTAAPHAAAATSSSSVGQAAELAEAGPRQSTEVSIGRVGAPHCAMFCLVS